MWIGIGYFVFSSDIAAEHHYGIILKLTAAWRNSKQHKPSIKDDYLLRNVEETEDIPNVKYIHVIKLKPHVVATFQTAFLKLKINIFLNNDSAKS